MPLGAMGRLELTDHRAIATLIQFREVRKERGNTLSGTAQGVPIFLFPAKTWESDVQHLN